MSKNINFSPKEVFPLNID